MSYLFVRVEPFFFRLFEIGLRQEEHCVDAQAEGEEGHDLGGGRVEGDVEEGAEAEAAGHADRHEEDAADAESGLGAHAVRPAVQRYARVDNLKDTRKEHCEQKSLGKPGKREQSRFRRKYFLRQKSKIVIQTGKKDTLSISEMQNLITMRR